MKHAPLLLIVVLFLLTGCDKEPDIVTPPVPLYKIAIEPEFVRNLKVLWFDDKSAAYPSALMTPATHYQVRTGLTARICAAHFLLIPIYFDWSGWQMLAG